METSTILSFLGLLPVLWLYTAYMSSSNFPTLSSKRILLLIAHPDDEVMFFAPTVLALTKPELGNHLKILCLSQGNADGLGEIRKKEIVKSGNMLGVRSEDVLVLDDPQLVDSPNPYPSGHLASLLLRTFAPSMATMPSTSAPAASIDALITFDKHGVSSHPNHKSCHEGAVSFMKQLMAKHAGWECPIALYTLTSVNILRKYAGILDAVGSVFACMDSMVLASDKEKRGLKLVSGRGKDGGDKSDKGARATPSWLLFISGLVDWNKAQRAMVQGHKSQMVWFRWGWVGLGRYMIVNDLRRVRT
ncbi:MAG: N-acetylglucosaminyl-phosphatidylinositol de-N-acetylase [Chrysothrix sp. TS-e1954]|nr:MAG: N-acetylglucosaminyl-phosphatidylinositol de-N-acetylase [Chrysothrix sp. TS-e1954]